MTEKEVQKNAAKAAEFEAEEFTFQDDEQRARYYKVLSEGYKTLWMDEAKKCETLVKELQELEDTLGLRNRSNPDLTIEPENNTTTLFDEWKNCKD